MINWDEGYSASYYAAVVDRNSWSDVEIFDITGGSISKEGSDLRQSADITTIGVNISKEYYFRIYMVVRQNSTIESVPLFTGIGTSPSINIAGKKIENSIQCYSVLKPLADIVLQRGWYAAKDMDCKILLTDLFRPIHAPLTIDNTTLKLTDYIVAEDNETNLSMIDKILYLMDWRLLINGDGSINIGPFPKHPSLVFSAMDGDIIEPNITLKNDWYNCPNAIRVVSGEIEHVEYDNSDNPWSVKNRQREVWVNESNCELSSGESIEIYAKRRLAALQEVSKSVSYTRAYNSKVNVGDVIRLNYPSQNLAGVYRIKSQQITLGFNAKTSEEVVAL